jgi:GTP-binding protein HflX
LFERPEGGDSAVLVHAGRGDPGVREELGELARSAGAEIIGELTSNRQRPDPRHFLGSGKVDELRDLVRSVTADVVICGVNLSPSQERNLEARLECRVMDRTRLILDIFAQRASSYEGKLQVELAQLEHLSTRLVRGWTHLDREKGGIGLRGPGEKQLETDRRLLSARIKQIRARLDEVRSRRSLSRRARKRAALPVVSLVGYTNSGKSTLFNRMTGANVMARDQLFATLDPTVRRLRLPGGVRGVMADTVGFVRQLPHDLVAAFEATLEESREAALLLHVVDAADPERRAKMDEVEDVLLRIGAASVPRLTVFNKIDAVDELAPGITRDEQSVPVGAYVSAISGAGIEALAEAIAERLDGVQQTLRITIPWDAAGIRAALFEAVDIIEETVDGDVGWLLTARTTQGRIDALLRRQDATAAARITVEGTGTVLSDSDDADESIGSVPAERAQ